MRLFAIATVLAALTACTSGDQSSRTDVATDDARESGPPDAQRPDFGPGADRDPAVNPVIALTCEPDEMTSGMSSLWASDTPPRPELATPESALRAHFNTPNRADPSGERNVPDDVSSRTMPERGFWLSAAPTSDARSIGYAEQGKHRENYRVSRSGDNWYVESATACTRPEPMRTSP